MVARMQHGSRKLFKDDNGKGGKKTRRLGGCRSPRYIYLGANNLPYLILVSIHQGGDRSASQLY
jgi:hypothetical protein